MFTLINLPYADNALEPVISAQTISFHHGKHLQAYVDNLNKLLPGTPWEALPLEEIVAATAPSASPAPAGNATAVFNNAGQILNHNLYFTQFAPSPASPDPDGKLVLKMLSEGVPADLAKGFPAVEGFQGFSDADSISSYARWYVLFCRLTGIMKGDTAGTFRPQSTLTRAECAKTFMNLYELGEEFLSAA